MQRTEPPPSVSIVGIGAATTRRRGDASASSARRPERRLGRLRHREHAGAVARTQFEHVAGEA